MTSKDHTSKATEPEESAPGKDLPLVERVKAIAAKAQGSGSVEDGQPKRRRTNKKLTATAFDNTQLSLFQSFLCNTEDEKSQLSNTIDLWDSVPRYSVSRQAMTRLRSKDGNHLNLLKLDFHYRQKNWRAVIQPARIEVKDKSGEVVEMDFYPSANEELIEDALRKIAADQSQGYFDKTSYRSGAVFSLHALRAELKRRGHTRSFQEIMQSLYILAKSNIEIINRDDSRDSIAISSYLPALAGVTRKDLEADPDAKWLAQFHPLVTQSIDQLTYRQYNYHQMMQHSTQLARWIHKQLAIKFTFAAIGKQFEMRFSTIRRDSALLNNFAEGSMRLAVKAVDDAFAELTPKVLMFSEKKVSRGDRNKIEDVLYTLTPSLEFVHAMKASNKRLQLAEGRTGKPLTIEAT